MKINQIIINETTTAGAIGTVAMPMGEMNKRTGETVEIRGLKPVTSIKKSKKKGPYQNSRIEESKQFDSEQGVAEGSDQHPGVPTSRDELYHHHLSAAKISKGRAKEYHLQQAEKYKPKQGVAEEQLKEDDLIIVPGNKVTRRNGLISKDHSRIDHEVEMARSDLISAMKNAKAIYQMIKNRTEEEGLEGWVQEKLIKAGDYLNAVKEYYDGKIQQEMMGGGVIAAGGVGESVDEATQWTRYTSNPHIGGRRLRPGEDQKEYYLENETGKAFIQNEKLVVFANLEHARSVAKKLKYGGEWVPMRLTDAIKQKYQLNEKFVSQQQAKLMYAAAEDPKIAKKTGVSQKVAREFIKKSRGQKVGKLPKKVSGDNK